MVIQRKKLAAHAVSVALVCAQFNLNQIALAQSVPISSSPPTAPPTFSTDLSNSGSAAPTSPLAPSPPAAPSTPAASSYITPAVASVLNQSLATPATVVYDFGLSGGTLNVAGDFVNRGNTTFYAVSSNPSVTTASIVAGGSIFNANGAILTTVLPQGGLPGYSNLVSILNLSLVATGNIFNAGTISSAGALNVQAGGAIVNTAAAAGASQAIMQAVGNLNLVSSAIANAGLMASSNNINITSQTAQNILINNTGGILSALNGSINVRDALFSSKYDFAVIGGDILARELRIDTGAGTAWINVNQLSPTLYITGSEAFVSASSNVNIARLNLTDDPIIFGADVVFRSERVNDVPTGICEINAPIVGGGANAIVEADVTQIAGQGSLFLTLSGNASLGSTPLSLSGPISITAQGNITTNSISTNSFVSLQSLSGTVQTSTIAATTGAILDGAAGVTSGTITTGGNLSLKSATGPIQAGTLTTTNGGAIGVQAFGTSGSITTGAIVSSNFVLVRSGADIHIPSITSGSGAQSGAVQIVSFAPVNIGGSNIGSISVNRGSIGDAAVHVIGKDAINVASAGAIQISGNGAANSALALDSLTTLTLPAGSFSLDSPVNPGSVWLRAGTIVANGTTASASGSGLSQGGAVLVGAFSVVRSGGLTLHADGSGGLVALASANDMSLSSGTDAGGNFRFSGSFNPTGSGPLSITGAGSLTATANGNFGNAGMFGAPISISGGAITLTANGTGAGNGGTALMQGSAINNTGAAVQLSANAAAGNGGFVEVDSFNQGANINIGATLGLSASGTNGGGVAVNSGGNITADTTRVNVRPTGTDGSGGSVAITASNNISFTGHGDINADGNGSGSGGSVQLTALGLTADLTIGGSSGQVSVSADGANGGNILLQTTRTLTINGPLSADGTSGGFGSVQLQAGFGSAAGNININDSVTAKSANGFGGFIGITSYNSDINIAAGKEVSASGANGGTVIIQAGRNLNVNGGTVSASGTQHFAGYVQLESMTTNGSISLGSGSSIVASGDSGTINLIHHGGTPITVASGAKIEAPGNAAGEAGVIEFFNPSDNVRVNIAGTVGSRINDTQDIVRFTTPRGVFIEGSGTILGQVTSTDAASISIAIGQAGKDLQVGVVQSSGNAFIATTAESSMGILIPANGSTGDHLIESTAGDVELQGSVIENNNLVKASGAIKLTGRGTALTVKGAGEFKAASISVPASVFGTLDVTIGDGRNLRLIAPTINIIAKNNLTINGSQSAAILDSSGSAAASGGSITLNTDGRISVAGKLTADGGGGSITITSNTSSVDLAAANITAVGGSVAGNGGTITITGSTQVNLPATSLAANGISSGGTIRVTGQSVNFSGPLTANAGTAGDGGTIIVSSTGSQALSITNSISVASGTSSGAGGKLFVTTGGNLTYSGSADLSGHGSNSNGGTLSLHAGGALTFTASSPELKVNAGATGHGGTIDLLANTINSQSPLSLTANGTGGAGNGGTITVSSIADLTLAAGSGATISTISANAAGIGNGGHITLSSGAVLTVSVPGGLSANAFGTGLGGSLSLSAGSSLVVTGSLSASGGGQISLQAPSLDLQGLENVTISVLLPFSGNQSGRISITSTGAGNSLLLGQSTALNAVAPGATVALKSAGNIGINSAIHAGNSALTFESSATSPTISVDANVTAGNITFTGSGTGVMTVDLASGQEISSSGTAQFSAQGNLIVTNGSTLNVSGLVNLSGRSIDVSGPGSISGNISAVANGASGTGSVSISQKEFAIQQIQSTGTIKLTGETITNNGLITTTGPLIQIQNFSTSFNLNLTSSGSSQFVSAGDTNITAAGGKVEFAGSHTLSASGTGGVTVTTSELVNPGTVNIGAGTFTAKTGTAAGTLKISGGGTIAGAILAIGTELGVAVSLSGGGQTFSGTTTVLGSKVIVAQGSILSSSGALTLRTPVVENDGSIRAVGQAITVENPAARTTITGQSGFGFLSAQYLELKGSQITVLQQGITGVISGIDSATASLEVIAFGGNLSIGNVSAQKTIHLEATHGKVNFVSTARISTSEPSSTIQIGPSFGGGGGSLPGGVTSSGTGTIAVLGSSNITVSGTNNKVFAGAGCTVSIDGNLDFGGGVTISAGPPEVSQVNPAGGPFGGTNPSQSGTPYGLQGATTPGLSGTSPPAGSGGIGAGTTHPGVGSGGNPPPQKTGNSQAGGKPSTLKPVAFLSRFVCGHRFFELHSLNSASLRIRHDGSGVIAGEDDLVLCHGAVLLESLRRTSLRIEGCDASLLVRAGSIVLVSINHGGFSVKNLHDKQKDSVQVCFEGQSFMVAPGEEIAFNQTSWTSKNPPRRQVRQIVTTGTFSVTSSEFSIPSILSTEPVFKSLRLSTEQEDSRLLFSVFKTAASLALVTGGHGQYKSNE